MPVVTALTPQIKNPEIYNLFLDGRFVCGVSVEVISEYKLKVGKDLAPDLVEEVKKDSELGKTYQRVLNYLALRPRSTSEIEQYLRRVYLKKKNPREDLELVTDKVIKRLKARKYVDDHEFTRWWIENRVNARRPSGKNKIQAELAKKGIRREVFELIWKESGVNPQELLKPLVLSLSKKYDLNNPVEKARFVRRLMSRGFSWDEIRSVLQ